MQAWLDAHGRAKVVNTDEWYLDFANQLLPLVAESYIYGGKEMEEDQKQVALTCALYLEDCVADGGNWRQFIHWHQANYGRCLPFYTLTDEYLPDEINREDVVFLLWAINSPVGDDLTEWRTRWMQICWSLQMYYTTVWMLRSNWLLSVITWRRTGCWKRN